jgi:hypothetical protein
MQRRAVRREAEVRGSEIFQSKLGRSVMQYIQQFQFVLVFGVWH